jgi:hypothetical protein
LLLPLDINTTVSVTVSVSIERVVNEREKVRVRVDDQIYPFATVFSANKQECKCDFSNTIGEDIADE